MYFGNDGGILAFLDFVERKAVFAVRILDTDLEPVPHSLILLTRLHSPKGTDPSKTYSAS